MINGQDTDKRTTVKNWGEWGPATCKQSTYCVKGIAPFLDLPSLKDLLDDCVFFCLLMLPPSGPLIAQHYSPQLRPAYSITLYVHAGYMLTAFFIHQPTRQCMRTLRSSIAMAVLFTAVVLLAVTNNLVTGSYCWTYPGEHII